MKHPPRNRARTAASPTGQAFANYLDTRLEQLGRLQATRAGHRLEQNTARSVLRLQRGLTGDRPLVGSAAPPYMEDQELLGAYLSYYWPVSYIQTSFALTRVGFGTRFPFQPNQTIRILDIGSGPGPCSAAALDLLTETGRGGPVDFVLSDHSDRALQLADRILQTPANAGSAATVHCKTMVQDSAKAGLPEGSYHLVMFGHSLNEMAASGTLLDGVLDQAVARLEPGGILLLIEPALLATARRLIAQRDRLLAAGLELLGPCTRHGACPVLVQGDNQTCHEEFAWNMPASVASLAAAAGLDRQRVKMAWFAFRKPLTAGLTEPWSASACVQGQARYRVVSDPMLNKAGRIRYLLCGEAGRFPLSANRQDSAAERAGFFRLARGHYLSIENPEQRENGWAMGPDTVLYPENQP